MGVWYFYWTLFLGKGNFMDFLKVRYQNGKLIFSDGSSRSAERYEKPYFRFRKELLAIRKRTGRETIIRWADLHRHTGYSLLDSTIRISDMVSHTEFAGAITDHGTMRGTLEYYQAMNKAGKFPIIGEEFYVESIDGKLNGNHLILLAKTYNGYKNLIKLSSEAYNHIYYKPHITKDLLKAYHSDIICQSACLSGEIARYLADGDYGKAKKAALWYQELFGDDYYLEIQRHKISVEEKVNPQIIRLSRELGIRLVATTDSHYVNKEDSSIHLCHLCIGTKSTVDHPARKFNGTCYHLQTADEMEKRFNDIPEALDSTLEILYKCRNFKIETGNINTPKFEIPAPFTSDEEYFTHLCREGMKRRFGSNISKEYQNRIDYEISVIKQMGYCGYFLIVQDFINWAKSHGVMVGPGRGSAAGSLAAYAMGITEIDPIKYGLLFERFLNPERVSYPDIDTDFSKAGRPKVIDYVRQKYGEASVSKIIDISCLRSRVVIRDVSRVLGFPPSFGDKISKAIPDDPKISLRGAMDNSQELQKMYQSNPDVQKVWNIALKLEGLPRGVSIHACGTIIAPSAVNNFLPQEIAKDRQTGERAWVTQYPGPQCEEMGLLKMDFLGLRTLDVISNTLELIKKTTGKSITFSQIPINDPRSYQSLRLGKTDGVFQMESSGMTNLMKDMFYDVSDSDTPQKGNEYFERLIAAVALYRPGPMDEIPRYIENMKTGNITYDTPKLEQVLKNTYGVLVYQEQAMMTVRILAGFSKGQSDIIRKGMAKKKAEILDEYGEYFIHGSEEHDGKHPEKQLNIAGCIKNGIPETTARIIWDKMKKFGAYAFNKSHACAYAVLGAKTAWLSTHYPVEFMASNLDSFIGNADKIHGYVRKCRQNKILILPPDINKSYSWFNIESKGIRFAMNAVKDVGDVCAVNIENEKEARGKFSSLSDFLYRMARYQKINKKSIEALIYSGALDCFDGTRAGKISAIPAMDQMIANVQKTDFDQVSLFGNSGTDRFEPISVPEKEEFDSIFLASREEEYLGIIEHYPTIKYRKLLQRKHAVTIERLLNTREKTYVFEGIVKNFRDIPFKTDPTKGIYVFVLEDETGSINCVIYRDRNTPIHVGTDIREHAICYLKGYVKGNPQYGPQAIILRSYILSDHNHI
ncbi:MAG TPA: DNA polymerase III subunit alpha [Clostridiales bacterium]|nr:DNA polymerase III subunit alpha [Clostridiales bacterium]